MHRNCTDTNILIADSLYVLTWLGENLSSGIHSLSYIITFIDGLLYLNKDYVIRIRIHLETL